MKKLLTLKMLFLLATLLLVSNKAIAQEPYAVLSSDKTTLTFYYDNQKEARGGMSIDSFSSTLPSWYAQREFITTVVFDDSFAACTSVISMAWWFYMCTNLTSITGLEKLNTTNVTDMRSMFFGCSSLTSLNLSGFNTASVTNMGGMFTGCGSLTSLDVSHFNTANVETMISMFQGCRSLTSLDVSNFNTAKVTDMTGLFTDCSSLTSLNVSNFNTTNVTYMIGMFDGCSSLTSLDLNNFNTANVTNMNLMFYKSSGLTTIYCNDTWDCGSSADMFTNCTSLKGAIAYDATKTDATYANPNTGYFTKTSGTSDMQSTGSAVDLGLSIYWASCNVGASSPEDIGGYYAWGETEEKELYGDNYAYADSETSFQDIGTDISGTQYDVARAKWGGSWRMPTFAECKELCSNCSWTWTSQGGVNGALVTGPNGNSIFLPAGGRKYGNKGLRDLDEYGCYWSSTVSSNTGTNSSAEFLLFYSGGNNTEGRNRVNGMTIRPVSSEATSIRSIRTADNSKYQPIYNLSGQRLSEPQKGINIIGGKKVVIK